MRGGSPGEQTGVPDSHDQVLRQPFLVWHSLHSPQVKTCHFVVAKYDAQMTHAGISGAQDS
jgi:hypothetical protein